MATKTFIGTSLANFKSVKFSPGVNVTEESVISIGLGPYQITQTGWNVAALAEAWNNSANGFYGQITASVLDDSLVLTCDIAGQDFEVTYSVDGAAGTVSTIQSLTILASGGTFTLFDGNETTGAISYNATPATLVTNIQNAINALSAYESGDVVVSYTNGKFYLDFSEGAYAGLAIALWTADTSSLTGGNAAATVTTLVEGNLGADKEVTISFPADGTHSANINAIQKLTEDDAVTSGEFYLELPTLGPIGPMPFNAGRSAIKQAFENKLGFGCVKVSGGPLATLVQPTDPGAGETLFGTQTNSGKNAGLSGSFTWSGSDFCEAIQTEITTYKSTGFQRWTLPLSAADTLLSANLTLNLTLVASTGTVRIGASRLAHDADWPSDDTEAGDEIVSALAGGVTVTKTFTSSGLQTVNIAPLIQQTLALSGWTSGDHILLVFQSLESSGGIQVSPTGNSLTLALGSGAGSPYYTHLPVTIEFIGPYAGTDVGVMTPSGSATIVVDEVQEGGEQTVENINGGTWALKVDISSDATRSFVVSGIPYDVTASILQSMIESVAGIGSCTVTGGPAPGTPFDLVFSGSYGLTAMTVTVISSLTGSFDQSVEFATVRQAIAAPEAENIWELVVIPGEGTLGVSSEPPLTSRAYFRLIFNEPIVDEVETDLGKKTEVFIPFYNINPHRIEDAINEAFGRDVVRVTRIGHSVEYGAINTVPTYLDNSSTVPLHFWYYKDTFRLVFCNDYQPLGSIEGITVLPASTSNENSTPAGPDIWMIDEPAENSEDDQDLYLEAQRVREGFVELDNLSTPIHEFSIRQVTDKISSELTYRAKLNAKYPLFYTGQGSSTVSRVGVARQAIDQKIRFFWDKMSFASNFTEQPTFTTVASTEPLPWDSTPESIEAALTGLFGSGNVSVSGSLFNSWLPESTRDNPNEALSYNDLTIRLTGELTRLPLNESGYTLRMTVDNPQETNTEQLRNVQAWIEPYNKPLPGGQNQRLRFSLTNPEAVETLQISVGNSTVFATPTTTAAELQLSLDEALGTTSAGIPEKNRRAVIVYGTTLSTPIELEASGLGYQFSVQAVGFGAFGSNVSAVILVTTTQEGIDPVAEVQKLVISGSPHSGTYTIDGGANLAYNANAATIQADLGTAPPTVSGTYPNFLLTWGLGDGNVSQLATTSSLNNSAVTLALEQQGGYDTLLNAEDVVSGEGPLYADVPTNYTPEGVPGSGDLIIFDDAVSALTFGLDQTSYFTVVSLGDNLLKHNRNRIVFRNNQKVTLTAVGTAPGGLTSGDDYYIINEAKDYTFQLSETPGGAAVDITSVGAGTFLLSVKSSTVHIYNRYAGAQIGLPNQNLATSLTEYLSRYWKLDGGTFIVGMEDEGPGISMLRLNTLTSVANVTVNDSAQGSSGVPAVLLLFDNADSTLEIEDGDVGVSFYSNESSLLDDITIHDGSLTLHAVTAATLHGHVPVVVDRCNIDETFSISS